MSPRGAYIPPDEPYTLPMDDEHTLTSTVGLEQRGDWPYELYLNTERCAGLTAARLLRTTQVPRERIPIEQATASEGEEPTRYPQRRHARRTAPGPWSIGNDLQPQPRAPGPDRPGVSSVRGAASSSRREGLRTRALSRRGWAIRSITACAPARSFRPRSVNWWEETRELRKSPPRTDHGDGVVGPLHQKGIYEAGHSLSQGLGLDTGAVREYIQGIEQLGYDYLTVSDHVLLPDVEVTTRAQAIR